MNRKLKEVLSTSLYLLVVLALTFLVITFGRAAHKSDWKLHGADG